jgi:signal transduction histidine kinase
MACIYLAGVAGWYGEEEMRHDTADQAFTHRSMPWWKARASGLQFRITLSYILTTLVAILMLEGLNLAFLAILSSTILPDEATQVLTPIVREQAEVYALEVQTQALDTSLNPQTTFRPHQPFTLDPPQAGSALAITYTASTGQRGESAPVALVITPQGRVLASSAPGWIPAGGSVTATSPAGSGLIAAALTGRAGSRADGPPTSLIVSAAEPVWNSTHAPIGAVYVQMPALPLHAALFAGLYPSSFVGSIFTVGLLMLVLPLVGGLFGTLATRRLVRRIRTLGAATRELALGNYAEQVPVVDGDELGQLERRFNHLAQELDESVRQRQNLAEENARLAERARISRELHDAISQDLFSLRLLSDGLQTSVAQDPTVQGHLATVQQTTARMSRALRALLLEMRPPELEHLGLAEALEALAALYRARLGIVVTTHLAPVTLPPAQEHALLRIVQEALNNAARHAEASALTIELDADQHGIRLRVLDDGRGFTPGGAEIAHGLGLRLMRERVQELGGNLTLESAPEDGTQLTIWLPRQGQEEPS